MSDYSGNTKKINYNSNKKEFILEKNKELLSKIGVEIDQDKVAIDLKRTKSFFASLQEILQQKAEQLQKNLEEGKLDMEDVGLKLDEERVEVDLKKTKTFIETFGQKVENFLKELEESVRQIDNPK